MDVSAGGTSQKPDVLASTEAERKAFGFRPDIDGMRGFCVVLVMFHHGYAAPSGGFVAIDVFFVISGFLITSQLLREQSRNGRISIAKFYARRVRRILPAATVVIITTVAASYFFLGFIAGNQTAEDAKWAALFSANIHFALLGTDYLGQQLPPSPLQHMWSLGVQEQFYIVWPMLMLAIVLIVRVPRRRVSLAAVLGIVIVASLGWSVLQTAVNAKVAYFSPLTRAWELALGALIAVLAPAIARMGQDRIENGWLWQLAAAVGVVGIAVSPFLLNASMGIPGYVVALPVVSSALLIAAGCGQPSTWVARGMAIKPLQWLGARSYSLYLWHWPLLTIVAQHLGERSGSHLSALQAGGLLVASLIIAIPSYHFVEKPIRSSRFLARRTGLTLLIGFGLIALTVAVAQWQLATHYETWNPLIAIPH